MLVSLGVNIGPAERVGVVFPRFIRRRHVYSRSGTREQNYIRGRTQTFSLTDCRRIPVPTVSTYREGGRGTTRKAGRWRINLRIDAEMGRQSTYRFRFRGRSIYVLRRSLFVGITTASNSAYGPSGSLGCVIGSQGTTSPSGRSVSTWVGCIVIRTEGLPV